MRLIKLLIAMLFCATASSVAEAELVVKVSGPKTTGSKVLIKLELKNTFTEKIESARAVVFLLDEQGKMVGQSTKWVIGGTKERSTLEPDKKTTFNFVIPAEKISSTNLIAKVSFNRVVLEGGKLADVHKDVHIEKAEK